MSIIVNESRLPAERRLAPSADGPAGALANVLTWSLPACLVVVAVAFSGTHTWAWDLRAFYNAAGAYVHHLNPYPAAHLSALTGQEVFVYPLPAAIAFIPLWLLPWPVATAVF